MHSLLRYLLGLISFLFSFSLNATHLMGGEITWDCMGNGRYKFYMTLYRDCSDPTQFQIQYSNPGFGLRVHNHPTVAFIPMTLLSRTDITPQCNILGPPADCLTQAPGSAEEHVFQSADIQLNGVPPAQGWIFTYSDCCRNTDIFNINAAGAVGMTLRAKMFSYQGNNNSSCIDSSPRFEAKPVTVICTSPQPPNQEMFVYNQNASDPDRDSVAYSFAEPLDFLDPLIAFTAINPNALNFNPTMSVASPFPGAITPGFPNSIPAVLDPINGQIALSVTGIGKFVSVVCVRSFRCGQLIAEVFREIQLISRACGNDNPPEYTVSVLDPTPGDYLVDLTVTAGDLVQFSINAIDNETIPASGATQIITLDASGGAFGALFSDPTSGCNMPPCATLNPPPPTSGVGALSTIFSWQTTCDHVMDATVSPVIVDPICYSEQTSNTFQISLFDDFCPYPAFTNITINVVVVAPPLTLSPELRCLEVMSGAGGDVKLTWISSPDPDNQFDAYHIFSSSNLNGPFVQIATIANISQNTYTHVGAGANVAPVYYYISTLTGCSGNILNIPTDTLSTMFLDLSVDALGVVDLNWSPLSNPLPVTSLLPYRVSKSLSTAAPAYLPFATPSINYENDAITGCNQQLAYYVELEDQLGCISLSNVDSGSFSTTAPPLPPTPDSVSVIGASNDVIVSWELGTNPLDDSLYIFKWDGSAWIKRDSANHVNESSKILAGDSPELTSIRYRLEAKDKCKVRSAPTTEHNTIWLNYSVDNCQALVNFTYMPYAAWLGSNLIYKVFVSENSAPFQLNQSVNALTGILPNLSVPNLMQGNNYCVYIQALDPITNQSSSSNIVCFTANVETPPNYTYLRTATVEASGSVYSACLIDPSANISSYAVVRSVWPGNAFDTLNAFPVLPGTNEIAFSDATTLSNEQSYTYKFVMYNKCNEVAGESNAARTMLLQGKADDGFMNKLYWNTYDAWDGQVFEYKVFRSLGYSAIFDEVFNAVTDTVFIDRVADEVDRELTFCYLIKAFEGPGNIYGIRDSSYSNVLCLTQKPTIYFPTAFTPGQPGENAIYKPQGLYETLAKNLKFAIYNRWGEEVFYTEDLTKGWDGTYKTRAVAPDIFAVRITFDLPDGTEFKHMGSVLVLY